MSPLTCNHREYAAFGCKMLILSPLSTFAFMDPHRHGSYQEKPKLDCELHEGVLRSKSQLNASDSGSPSVIFNLANGKKINLLTSSSEVSTTDVIDMYIGNSPYSLGLLPANLQLNPSTCDIKSPVPQVSFSPTNKEHTFLTLKRRMTIEELLESESNYVLSMRLVMNFYIEPLIASKCRSEVFVIIGYYLEILIKNHTRLLQFMNSTLADISIGTNSLIIAAAFANSVCTLGTDLATYRDFISTYEDLVTLTRKSAPSLQSQIIAGAESFLAATQPPTKHMDLSFISLLQRPVTRMPKYRLMVESLLKYTFHLDQNYKRIEYSLHTIRAKLTQLNDSLNKSTNPSQLQLLSAHFGESISPPIEFFGRSYLLGTLSCVWIQGGGNVIEHQLMAICCKSHLLLCMKLPPQGKASFDYYFMIPFRCCARIVDKNKESADFGGLYTDFVHRINIRFEYKFAKYEILLLCTSAKECEIWTESLQTLIYLNGPNPLDYTQSDLTDTEDLLTIRLPANYSPYDVYIKNTSASCMKLCYFLQVVHVRVSLFDESKDIVDFKDHNSVAISYVERTRLEQLLMDIWSPELPRILDCTNHAKIRKVSSWTWGRSMRKNSQSNILQRGNLNRDTMPLTQLRETRPESRLLGLF